MGFLIQASPEPTKTGSVVRTHGGMGAKWDSSGCPLPNPKQNWLSHWTGSVNQLMPTDPTSALEWPPQPPLLLMELQLEDLGEYIDWESKHLQEVGFKHLVAQQEGHSDFSPGVRDLLHNAATFLRHLKNHGATISLSTPPWEEKRLDETITRGPHKPANDYVYFLREELLDFVQKEFWMDIHISPMDFIPQRAQWPRIIIDYSFFSQRLLHNLIQRAWHFQASGFVAQASQKGATPGGDRYGATNGVGWSPLYIYVWLRKQ
jgi:hypothetical protein